MAIIQRNRHGSRVVLDFPRARFGVEMGHVLADKFPGRFVYGVFIFSAATNSILCGVFVSGETGVPYPYDMANGVRPLSSELVGGVAII
jgi:hypothetical protein